MGTAAKTEETGQVAKTEENDNRSVAPTLTTCNDKTDKTVSVKTTDVPIKPCCAMERKRLEHSAKDPCWQRTTYGYEKFMGFSGEG